ncbi:hypothetical protein GEU84_009825 [Fertoebacter nigrum]|uniref:Peptidase inhibitor I78 family protein n=1 Tax=Fertoeibacter niger TaxID=2656921 RepID=A0A8X8H076_9RHOB|nr:I78 family peptidase inhibitor [Fertoeibacter niger]NUB44681.1 hypothetical protein [Fertoeibacter niger]
MMRLALAMTAAAALAACQMETPPAPPADLPENACGAAALQNLVGQPASVLETMRFAATTRIIRPDMAVTMDFSPERLNIEIDRAEMISRVACG